MNKLAEDHKAKILADNAIAEREKLSRDRDLKEDITAHVHMKLGRIQSLLNEVSFMGRIHRDKETNPTLNQIVGIIGYRFSEQFGWMRTLELAMSVVNDVIHSDYRLFKTENCE